MPHLSSNDWSRIIDLQRTSGLTIAEFCTKHNLSPKTFYHHQYELTQTCQIPDDDELPTFVQVTQSQDTSVTASITKPTPKQPEPWVQFTYGQTKLQIPLSISPIWVSTLIKELNS